MTDKHRELHLESDIVAHLTAHDWLGGDPQKYNRQFALYPEDLIGWLKETQPKGWAKAEKRTGGQAAHTVPTLVAKLLGRYGSLHVLRHGFKDVDARFQLCQFKPTHGLNQEILDRYRRVRCRVVRQVNYSQSNENSIDLVLFVNGFPVATVEVKTYFTQAVEDAVRQYKIRSQAS